MKCDDCGTNLDTYDEVAICPKCQSYYMITKDTDPNAPQWFEEVGLLLSLIKPKGLGHTGIGAYLKVKEEYNMAWLSMEEARIRREIEQEKSDLLSPSKPRKTASGNGKPKPKHTVTLVPIQLGTLCTECKRLMLKKDGEWVCTNTGCSEYQKTRPFSMRERGRKGLGKSMIPRFYQNKVSTITRKMEDLVPEWLMKEENIGKQFRSSTIAKALLPDIKDMIEAERGEIIDTEKELFRLGSTVYSLCVTIGDAMVRYGHDPETIDGLIRYPFPDDIHWFCISHTGTEANPRRRFGFSRKEIIKDIG